MNQIINWQKFDYDKPPKSGVYWFVTERPQFDIDVDSYGEVSGIHTGNTVTDICLAHIDIYPEGFFELIAADPDETGRMHDDAVITHFAVVNMPEPPK